MATEKKVSDKALNPKDLYEDKRTEKKIEKHLTDETDEIDEQDIANAPAGVVNKTTEEQLKKKDAAETDVEPLSGEKNIKDNEDPSIGTTWNILGS